MTPRNCIQGAALAAAAFAFAAAEAATDANAELDLVRQRVAEAFEMIEPGDVKASPVDGWYMIQRSSVVAYISSDGRYLLQGDMIDLDTSVNLSELARTDSRREIMAAITDDQVIKFSPAEIKYSVSIFTDVECTYCRRLHSQIDDYLAKGIEVRYLMYPRNGPASRAWNTAEEIWCSTDRKNALTMAKLDRKFSTSSCDATMVEDHFAMGRNIGLSGTPAILFDDGTLIAGYLAPDQLVSALEENAK